MEFIFPGQVSAEQTMVVEKAHTADQIDSGKVDVLATPMMIGLMEAAAVDAVQEYHWRFIINLKAFMEKL